MEGGGNVASPTSARQDMFNRLVLKEGEPEAERLQL
jgi:hypothetical protein